MKKVNKLAATVAMALGLGAVVPQTNATIEQWSNSRGDTLLFPVFYGYTENYFTISNSANAWIHGHLRFRGAGWSGELLDFDVILSPGDVFVFRLADIDGDGFWEIDASLDPKNFQYTGMLTNCSPEGGVGTPKEQCKDQYSLLIPPADNGRITPEVIRHHRNVGYVEFIGEGVLSGMTADKMRLVVDKDNQLNQRRVDNNRGTSIWAWLDQNGSGSSHVVDGNTVLDVPNALSGTAFITIAGDGQGIAYNAEALVNFRTCSEGTGGVIQHRLDHELVAGAVDYNRGELIVPATGIAGTVGCGAVIVHHENAAAPPATYPYLYGYKEEDKGGLAAEGRISFNNTWGPTLADGDDYSLDGLRWTFGTPPNSTDNWDQTFGNVNSIAEVEEAIRKGDRQNFTGFYFDRPELESNYFAFFPTKFYYGEERRYWVNVLPTNSLERNATDKLTGPRGYITAAVEHLLGLAKPFVPEVWDIFENAPQSVCIESPCISPEPDLLIGEELAFFSITNVKNTFGTGKHQSWEAGRIALKIANANNFAAEADMKHRDSIYSFPGLVYAFDMGTSSSGGVFIGNWRALER
jgi:hypothetical protein